MIDKVFSRESVKYNFHVLIGGFQPVPRDCWWTKQKSPINNLLFSSTSVANMT